MQKICRHSAGAYTFRKSTPFLIHYVLFIVSFVFGVLSVVYGFTFTDSGAFATVLSKTVNNSYLNNFLSYLISCAIISAAISLCGFFTFGVCVSMPLFVFYGLGVGALFAHVCNQCGAVGIAVNLTLFLIPSILTFALLTFISSSSVYFSTGLAVAVFSNRSIIGIKNRMNDMLLLLAFSLPCYAAISALRALLIMIFSGVFFA